MKITMNGTITTISSPKNINDFLSEHGYKDKLIAIAINNHFIARSSYNDYIIKENDAIEIVAPMQGG
ncbi:MAG: thiamine biosynthesis protein ThiS [Zetaproteobacteria bacterium]|nr:MAG: thiamine biosynthesis protein ThiS [Zetaproteobacteria bacterium]